MHPDDQLFYHQGIAKIEAGEFAAAVDLLDQALQQDPNFSPAYYQRGRAYVQLNQFQQAITDFTRALMADPSQPSWYYARALAHLNLNQLESAVADAKDAIQRQPDFGAAYHLLGTVRHKQGLTAKAIASYKKAAELYLDQQDVANGRRCLELIRQLKPVSQPDPPKLPPAIHPDQFLQHALEKANRDVASAIEDLDWAIQIDSQNVLAYVYRAQVRAKYDDRWGAIADYRQAAKLYLDRADPARAKQMLAQIEQLTPSRMPAAPVQTSPAQTVPRAIRYRVIQPASGRISSAVQRKLLRLVGDDRQIAAGLVARLRQKHPGMPEDWYWEKAIYDLERDRR